MTTTAWWIVGWIAGAAVVVVAAALLLAIIALARRVTRQAGEIEAALDGARANTEPLFGLAAVNDALVRIAAGLEDLRAPAKPGLLVSEEEPR